MTCYAPNRAYLAKPKENGKANIVWRRSESEKAEEIFLPCGKCIGCGLSYSRQWAIRCVHEASLYEENCFITLTYDEDHVPLDRSLNVKTFQDFIKRLRKHEKGKKIRYFHAGEYGEGLGRPHYHAILFNHSFDDKKVFTIRNDERVYVSETLNKLWPYGIHEIGQVNFASAAYVAGYCIKKQKGLSTEHKKAFYGNKRPEYTTMSRRPGIGKGWLDKYQTDVYPEDEIIINGQKWRPPRFYDNKLEEKDKILLDEIKEQRVKYGKKLITANLNHGKTRIRKTDSDYLLTQEKVALAKQKLKKSNLREGY